jgi:hypothetical protein
MMRITTASIHLTKPAAKPMTVPITADNMATENPTVNDTRAP